MDYASIRNKMVEEQLIPRGIKNQRVLEAFRKVERHNFIPADLWESAYADFPVPIGWGQTISQPYIVALMTECLDLMGEEKVLEIGTGSGYQAAILAELAKEVYSVERIASLAKSAELTFKELGYSNIKIKVDDGSLGWPEQAPFERIIVTAATPIVPLPLVEQLKEKGKLILPLGETFSQVLTIIEKKQGKISSTSVCGCVFVPLVGKYGYNRQVS
ncbi:MAG: protein-L-isoaspartate(D-aspartate) O-methyltransferase [Candidatus Omnitrophica bacterium]|nr:protein-L-isoaspartate(D-aspartate) O-methyltransferase [Candidatus Omnitrophota bacterium]